MSGRVKRWIVVYFVGAVCALSFYVSKGEVAVAADGQKRPIEVELTESFYRALRAEGDNKTYRTDASEEYLRQIAVSSRFAVESNLKIIKQQERMIELLEALKTQKN